MADILGLCLRLADTLAREGGFSYDPWTGGTPTAGYAVSVDPNRNRRHVGYVSAVALYDYLLDHADILREPGKVFGAWRDTETGTVHLDVSTVVSDRDKALALAREHGELAVWSYAAQQEIRVTPVSA